MARHIGPKNKLSRRVGMDLFNKGVKMRRLTVLPGVHGMKRRRKPSEYNNLLKEKQKIRFFYGLLEKQFKNYYAEASRQQGPTGVNLLQLLERRLDNLLVRAGLCPTRAMARQLIVHNHVQIDGKRVNRPSYQIKPDQVITLGEKALAMPTVIQLMQDEDVEVAKWVQRKASIVKVKRAPVREDISEEFDEQMIVEYYSR